MRARRWRGQAAEEGIGVVSEKVGAWPSCGSSAGPWRLPFDVIVVVVVCVDRR